jgi:hypothetical protein
MGLAGTFNVLKFDTLYSTVDRSLAVKYYGGGANYLKAYYRVKSTFVISIDTLDVVQNNRLPASNAGTNTWYGLGAGLRSLDDPINPRKGYSFIVDLSSGTRVIDRDSRIEGLTVKGGSLYDNVLLKSTQYNLEGDLEIYFNPYRKHVIMTRLNSEHLVSPNIYFNEVKRFGGANSLRGFNEQSIFATSFTMFLTEYRYLLSGNNFLRVFVNGAYYENKGVYLNNSVYDTPVGFGIGANLEIASGNLSLLYALGRQKDSPFEFRSGKVHVSLSSYF